MLDKQPKEIQVIAVTVTQQLQSVALEAQHFCDVRQVVNSLREQFPTVAFFGPQMNSQADQVTLELTYESQTLKLQVAASRDLLEENQIGW